MLQLYVEDRSIKDDVFTSMNAATAEFFRVPGDLCGRERIITHIFAGTLWASIM